MKIGQYLAKICGLGYVFLAHLVC